jgi:hypothetical protein
MCNQISYIYIQPHLSVAMHAIASERTELGWAVSLQHPHQSLTRLQQRNTTLPYILQQTIPACFLRAKLPLMPGTHASEDSFIACDHPTASLQLVQIFILRVIK